MTAERLATCLIESALVGFVVLACGALAVKLCRQPIKRISLIQWTLIVAIATPLLLRLPLTSPWSFAVLPPLSAEMDRFAALPSEAEERAAVLPTGGPTGGAGETGSCGRQMQPVALKHSDTAAPLRRFPALPAWQTMLVALYGLAASILLARLGIGIVARRLLLSSAAPVPAAVATLLSDVGGQRGRRVRLLVSDRIQSPVTWGLWRPVIVLPSHWCEEKSAAELRLSLAHEWSHIEQRDIASSYLALAAEFVCFYQPVFWWLRRKLALCQDHVADARAAGVADAPEDYAAFLLSVARQRADRLIPGALGISSSRSDLSRRITMLCSSELVAQRSSFRWDATIAAAALLAIASINAIRLEPVSAAEPPSFASDELSDHHEVSNPLATEKGKNAWPPEFLQGAWRVTRAAEIFNGQEEQAVVDLALFVGSRLIFVNDAKTIHDKGFEFESATEKEGSYYGFVRHDRGNRKLVITPQADEQTPSEIEVTLEKLSNPPGMDTFVMRLERDDQADAKMRVRKLMSSAALRGPPETKELLQKWISAPDK